MDQLRHISPNLCQRVAENLPEDWVRHNAGFFMRTQKYDDVESNLPIRSCEYAPLRLVMDADELYYLGDQGNPQGDEESNLGHALHFIIRNEKSVRTYDNFQYKINESDFDIARLIVSASIKFMLASLYKEYKLIIRCAESFIPDDVIREIMLLRIECEKITLKWLAKQGNKTKKFLAKQKEY